MTWAWTETLVCFEQVKAHRTAQRDKVRTITGFSSTLAPLRKYRSFGHCLSLNFAKARARMTTVLSAGEGVEEASKHQVT